MTDLRQQVRARPTAPMSKDRNDFIPATDDETVRKEFDQYYMENFPLLVRFLMRQGATSYEAADAAQEAFIAALPQWHNLHSPRAWLRTVAFRQYLRQNSDPATELFQEEVRSAGGAAGGRCAMYEVMLREEEQHVIAALSSLPTRQREVMAWHLDHFTTAEIAAELNMQPAAVRQNLARARGQLKVLLGLVVGGEQ